MPSSSLNDLLWEVDSTLIEPTSHLTTLLSARTARSNPRLQYFERIGKRRSPGRRGGRRELLNTALASLAPLFRTKCIVNGHRTMAMIDLGATGNFMSRRFVNENRIATCEKNDGYELIAVDGSRLPDVDSKTILLLLAIQRHYEEITLDVLNTASYDIVLGMPWLENHNLVID